MQVEVCKEQVEWATKEKRTFLRQRIEARLANLHLGAKDYSAALALISRLLTEVRAAASLQRLCRHLTPEAQRSAYLPGCAHACQAAR